MIQIEIQTHLHLKYLQSVGVEKGILGKVTCRLMTWERKSSKGLLLLLLLLLLHAHELLLPEVLVQHLLLQQCNTVHRIVTGQPSGWRPKSSLVRRGVGSSTICNSCSLTVDGLSLQLHLMLKLLLYALMYLELVLQLLHLQAVALVAQ